MRAELQPPFEAQSEQSPLAGFRSAFDPAVDDTVMLEVRGLPPGAGLRIASLDSYNGIVYAVGGDDGTAASGRFTRVPYRLDQSDAGRVGESVERVRLEGVTEAEVARARRQLRARLVFENDSVTNIAHQLGYFETVAGPGYFDRVRPCIDAVTAEQVSAAARARLARTTQTIGWFQPTEPQP